MVHTMTRDQLTRIRKLLCIFCLILFILCEAYSGAALVLDRSEFDGAQEHILGWLSFFAASVLTLGLFLLLRAPSLRDSIGVGVRLPHVETRG